MQAIATDRIAWMVDLSVCLLLTFVSFTRLTEPIWMPFGADFGGPKEPMGPDSQGEGAIWGLSAPLKSIGRLCSSIHKNG